MKNFKVNFSYSNHGPKIKQSQLVKAPDEKTAATILEIWKKSIHSDITGFKVIGCLELNEKQIKLSNPNNFITPENYDRWVKDKKTIAITPAKAASKTVAKSVTQISWLPKKPTEKTVTGNKEKVTAKPVTQIPWLKKKTVTKNTEETEWDKINALSHNKEFDNQ